MTGVKYPNPKSPFFLAGGLDESNIKAAMDTIAPYALDVSSSVETDGIKNFSKIKRIMEIVRNE